MIVRQNGKEHTTLFRLLRNSVLIKYGDNGNLSDDKFALWVDNKQSELMPSGSRVVNVEDNLRPGNYKVELKGIEAPDDVGTYYICFSDNVRVLTGSAELSGRDLLRNKTKYFNVEVSNAVNPTLNNCRFVEQSTQSLRIIQNG